MQRARRAQSDKRCDVERDAAHVRLPERTHRTRTTRLRYFDPFGFSGLAFVCIPVERCNRRTAVAADFGRDALRYFACGCSVDEPILVRMGMNVDEPRRQRETATRNGFERLSLGKFTDKNDAIAECCDICDVRRLPEPS